MTMNMGHGFYVMSVDDDSDDQDLIEEALGQTGHAFRLERLSNGSEFLSLLDSLGNDKNRFPQLILLDLNMPAIGGSELLRILKAEGSAFRHVPVIILTTSGSETDINSCYNNGADLYCVKPSSYRKLVTMLDECLKNIANKAPLRVNVTKQEGPTA